MLANPMRVPRRARLEGRGGWNLRAVPADQQPITQDQLDSLVFDTQAEALDFYEYLLRAYSVRTKLAFLSDLLSKIQAAPVVSSVFAGDPTGQTYEAALQSATDAFMGLMQPNAFQNLQIVRNQMEVNVLPKQFSLGVRARIPAFQSGMTQLSYSDVVIPMPQMQDYGDFTQTSLLDDMTRMQELASQLSSTFQLSGRRLGIGPLALAMAGIIVVGVWGTLAGLWALLRQYQAPQSKIVDLLSQAKAAGADVTVLSDLLLRVQESGGMLHDVSSVLKWGAITAGVLAAGGLAWHFFG